MAPLTIRASKPLRALAQVAAPGVTRPPFIHPDTMPDQYALTGVGRCMEPLIRDGALVVFDKRQEPRCGDIVGLVLTREAAQRWGVPGLLKRLALALPPSDLPAGCQGMVVVDQINPPRRYALSTADVRRRELSFPSTGPCCHSVSAQSHD